MASSHCHTSCLCLALVADGGIQIVASRSRHASARSRWFGRQWLGSGGFLTVADRDWAVFAVSEPAGTGSTWLRASSRRRRPLVAPAVVGGARESAFRVFFSVYLRSQ